MKDQKQNKKQLSRKFKGIWIERILWLCDLSVIQKCLIAEIDSLDCKGRGCYASNSYLAAFLGISRRQLITTLKELTNKGIVISENTKHRYKLDDSEGPVKRKIDWKKLREIYKFCDEDNEEIAPVSDGQTGEEFAPVSDGQTGEECDTKLVHKMSQTGEECDTKLVQKMSQTGANFARLYKEENTKRNLERERDKKNIPSLSDVLEYFKQENFTSNPTIFFNYYQAHNWPQGDWQSLAKVWQARERAADKKINDKKCVVCGADGFKCQTARDSKTLVWLCQEDFTCWEKITRNYPGGWGTRTKEEIEKILNISTRLQGAI